MREDKMPVEDTPSKKSTEEYDDGEYEFVRSPKRAKMADDHQSSDNIEANSEDFYQADDHDEKEDIIRLLIAKYPKLQEVQVELGELCPNLDHSAEHSEVVSNKDNEKMSKDEKSNSEGMKFQIGANANDGLPSSIGSNVNAGYNREANESRTEKALPAEERKSKCYDWERISKLQDTSFNILSVTLTSKWIHRMQSMVRAEENGEREERSRLIKRFLNELPKEVSKGPYAIGVEHRKKLHLETRDETDNKEFEATVNKLTTNHFKVGGTCEFFGGNAEGGPSANTSNAKIQKESKNAFNKNVESKDRRRGTTRDPAVYLQTLPDGENSATLSLPNIIRDSGDGPDFKKAGIIIQRALEAQYVPPYVWVFPEPLTEDNSEMIKITETTLHVSDFLELCHAEFYGRGGDDISPKNLQLKNSDGVVLKRSDLLSELRWHCKTTLQLCKRPVTFNKQVQTDSDLSIFNKCSVV